MTISTYVKYISAQNQKYIHLFEIHERLAISQLPFPDSSPFWQPSGSLSILTSSTPSSCNWCTKDLLLRTSSTTQCRTSSLIYTKHFQPVTKFDPSREFLNYPQNPERSYQLSTAQPTYIASRARPFRGCMGSGVWVIDPSFQYQQENVFLPGNHIPPINLSVLACCRDSDAGPAQTQPGNSRAPMARSLQHPRSGRSGLLAISYCNQMLRYIIANPCPCSSL